MERTEWRLAEQPLGWLTYLAPLPLVAIVAMDVLKTPPITVRFWLGVAVTLVLVAVGLWAAQRCRVRLTEDGVEVRQLRTRVYRWEDISAVQVAPAWDRAAVWLRTRDMHPQAAPEVLPVPLGRGRRPSDTTLADAAASIARRSGIAERPSA